MGIVRMGVPEQIVKDIAQKYSIDVFVETGTYKADTSVWASTIFSKVFTVEASPEIYKKAVRKFGTIQNIQFLQGNSKERLKDIVDQLDDQQALFWLDAHWSGERTFGERNECPLLHELHTILAKNSDHIILIDDARMFLAPPPKPHDLRQWPGIDEICNVIIDYRYKIIVYDDVIFVVPSQHADGYKIYFQELATKHWQLQANKISFFQRIKTALGNFSKGHA